MKITTVTSVVCLALLLPAASALAGGDSIKPGLWEIQNKTAVDGQAMPDMSEMMAQVPPEMRGQVEAMMAKNGAGMTSKGVTICITPEQASGGQYGAAGPDSQCTVTDTQHSGNTTRMKMVCSQPKGEGETTVTRVSDTAWTSATTMTVEEGGSTHAMNMEASARWLKSDCGTVKSR